MDAETLLHSLKAKEVELREQYESQLAELANQIDAVQITIGLLGSRDARPAVSYLGNEVLSMETWRSIVEGMTHLEALRAIAKKNDGLVKVREARRILIGTGLTKSKPRYVAPHIHNLLRNADDFEYDSPGTFRLT